MHKFDYYESGTFNEAPKDKGRSTKTPVVTLSENEIAVNELIQESLKNITDFQKKYKKATTNFFGKTIKSQDYFPEDSKAAGRIFSYLNDLQQSTGDEQRRCSPPKDIQKTMFKIGYGEVTRKLNPKFKDLLSSLVDQFVSEEVIDSIKRKEKEAAEAKARDTVTSGPTA